MTEEKLAKKKAIIIAIQRKTYPYLKKIMYRG